MGKISPEERAAIDKAVAEWRVTKIPVGVSGIDISQPNGWKEQRTAFFKTRERKKNPAVTARRERIKALRGEQGRHCGNCGLCWASDAAIVFVEH